MIRVKATISIRLPSGKFPRGSKADALKSAVPRLVRDTQDAFASARDPRTGRPWPPRARPHPWPPLRKTGRLYRAALLAAAAASVTGSTLTVRVPRGRRYFAYQQTGTRKMPARPYLGVSVAARRLVARKLAGQGLRVWRSPRGG